MTHCQHIQDLLFTSITDGTAAPAETALVNEHLAACQHCRDIRDSVARTQHILQTAGTTRPEPPPHIWAHIQAKIQPEQPGEHSLWNIINEIFGSMPRTAWAGFAILLILALGVTPAVINQQSSPLSEDSLALLITTDENEQDLFNDTINLNTKTEYFLQTKGETI